VFWALSGFWFRAFRGCQLRWFGLWYLRALWGLTRSDLLDTSRYGRFPFFCRPLFLPGFVCTFSPFFVSFSFPLVFVFLANVNFLLRSSPVPAFSFSLISWCACFFLLADFFSSSQLDRVGSQIHRGGHFFPLWRTFSLVLPDFHLPTFSFFVFFFGGRPFFFCVVFPPLAGSFLVNRFDPLWSLFLWRFFFFSSGCRFFPSFLDHGGGMIWVFLPVVLIGVLLPLFSPPPGLFSERALFFFFFFFTFSQFVRPPRPNVSPLFM